MTFEKRNFAIRTRDGLQWRDGYIFEACFSNGWLHEMAVYKEKARDALHRDNWIVSDINTGLAVCDWRTRKDAVKKFQDVHCSKLERMVYDDNSHHGMNTYEKMCADFAEMLETFEAATEGK